MPTYAQDLPQTKRFDEFKTIDWVQDAARDQLRTRLRKSRTFRVYGRATFSTLVSRLTELLESIQGWLVLTLIGLVVGSCAAILNIATEWLSGFKSGYCSTGFYLNEEFCCWGEEDGCPEWHEWSSWTIVNYVAFILFSVAFGTASAYLVKIYAPTAAGSGISEIKCIVSGFVLKGFLSGWTFAIKALGLPLSIASGLSVGKEGPSVHYAVAAGNVIARLFQRYRHNATKMREIQTACAATGVAVAFASPIGGVLFSLEEISSKYTLRTMWKSYYCAMVGIATLAAWNPFRTGQLVMFQVHYDRDWHFFEIVFYLVIGIFGGLYGLFITKFFFIAQSYRKKYLANFVLQETAALAMLTAMLCYFNIFLTIDMTESMQILFRECIGSDGGEVEDYHGLCSADNRKRMALELAYAVVVRSLLVIVSYGLKVPAGIFVPSMAIGAYFGRMVGIGVEALYAAHPTSAFFSVCNGEEQCITPGTYAFLGAAAALSGIMNITVTVVVIMFELTGALTYILPTMIVVGVTKIINSRFGKGGIADQAIVFNGMPFIDNKEEPEFDVNVAAAMTSELTVFPAYGITLAEIETALAESSYGGFPVVEDRQSMLLMGFIGRAELMYAIERAKGNSAIQPSVTCFFTTPDQDPVQIPRTSRNRSTIFEAPPIDADAAERNATQEFEMGEMLDRQEISSPSNLAVDSSGPTSRPLSPAPPPYSEEGYDIFGSSLVATPQESSSSPPSDEPGLHVDFAQFINLSPITVNPDLPLEAVAETFVRVGPRVVLVEERGVLVGLITQKDLLRYHFRHPHLHH
ncbi:chloride channel [Myxozyma melibiosi]|uniref:Chloride channel protein n=1 Tax=Myxozyma melibiosi TaxID=54550 RepID=A0ABR1EZY1_9ASCO